MTTTQPATPEQLHARMVQTIIDRRATALSEGVIAALRAVPRHAFLPDAPLEDAYNPRRVVITKRTADGTSLSCASVPSLVAGMLQHLRVRPGDHIYECGAGTGYNAALLAHLTGPGGLVTSADIDQEVTDGAVAALNATEYSRVQVLTRDGALGAEEHAPFDRIIVTVGAWDLPGAWFRQLKPGGRLVVPLRWRGQTRCVAFAMDHDRVLRSDTVSLCGFVPMIGQDGEHTATINADPTVRLHFDADQPIDPAALNSVLDERMTTAWSGATIGPEDPVDGIWLRATATDPEVCRIDAARKTMDDGVFAPVIPARSPALVSGTSLAYLANRLIDGPERHYELGALGYGPDGQALADRLCHHIQTWDTDRTATPTVTATLLADSRPMNPAHPAIIKEHCAITVTY